MAIGFKEFLFNLTQVFEITKKSKLTSFQPLIRLTHQSGKGGEGVTWTKTEVSSGSYCFAVIISEFNIWWKLWVLFFTWFVSKCPSFEMFENGNICSGHLTFLWRWSLAYRNQSIEFHCNSMDWFLYDRDLRRERVNTIHDQAAELFYKNVYACLLILLHWTWTQVLKLPQWVAWCEFQTGL